MALLCTVNTPALSKTTLTFLRGELSSAQLLLLPAAGGELETSGSGGESWNLHLIILKTSTNLICSPITPFPFSFHHSFICFYF